MNSEMIEEVKKILKKEPGLKAKEVAKKLREKGFQCVTTDANRILHFNPKLFLQDKALSTWTLLANKETPTITFAADFEYQWITSDLFERILTDSTLDFDKLKEIQFILPKECKFLLEAIARLLALCNQLVKNKRKVTIDLSENANSLHYLSRAGFFNQLSEKVTVLPNRPDDNTYQNRKGKNKNLVEFGAVIPKDQNKELVKQLTESFISRSSKKYDDAAFTIFSELIGNIKEHSDSKLDGFAALQIYNPPNKPSHIQSVVSDSGVGIATSLRPALKAHYPKLQKLTDIELVKMVMSEGQISKHGADSGHGLGFKSSKEKALKFNAKYSVRQSDFSLEFQFKNGKLQPIKELTDLVNISGTHICFDFDIDESDSD